MGLCKGYIEIFSAARPFYYTVIILRERKRRVYTQSDLDHRGTQQVPIRISQRILSSFVYFVQTV